LLAAGNGTAAISNEGRIVKGTTEAREGVTGHNVRYVLIGSLTGIIIVFAGLWFYYFS